MHKTKYLSSISQRDKFQPVLKDNTEICLLENFDTIREFERRKKMRYNHDAILERQSNVKHNACTNNSIYFDLVHDFGSPMQHLLPFLFFDTTDNNE